CALSSFLFVYTVSFSSLPSFPTRRSSDLVDEGLDPDRASGIEDVEGAVDIRLPGLFGESLQHRKVLEGCGVEDDQGSRLSPSTRSEEHTSELQSRFDLVCRLLLQTKNRTR